MTQERIQPTEVEGPPNFYQGFMFFSLAALVPDTKAPCPIRLEGYNQSLGRLRLVEALAAGDFIPAEWRNRLLAEGVRYAYVLLEDLPALQAYLHTQAMRLLEKSTEEVHRLVYENALCAIKTAMLDPKNGRRLAQAATTVRELIQHIWENEESRQGLLRIMTHNQELYTHSLNVCLLGVGLATALGWDHKEGERLGLALFFHDLGLAEDTASSTEPPVVNLENEEALRHHPEVSARYLSRVPDLDPAAIETVLCHHENLDGSGFPRKLQAKDIPPAARLARIVDLYERATSGILTAEALSPFAALHMMRYDMADKLDQDILGTFVRFLGQV